MDSGKVIRELREQRFIKSTDIERISRSIASVKGNADFYISHSTLADVEAGSVPSIHKLFSLAFCLRVPLEEILLVFDIGASEGMALDGQGEPVSRGASEMWGHGFRFALNFDAAFNRETRLLNPNPLESPALPNRTDPKRYRYALIGLTDDTMGELIPPGSVVEIDVMQNVVKVSDWKTIRERPVYLVWHADGHSCCWCNQEGKELTLLPYPLSRRPVRRFKVPQEASVIGRVINAWLSFDGTGLERDSTQLPKSALPS